MPSANYGRKDIPGNGVQIFSAYTNQRRAKLASIWAAIRKQVDGAGSTIAFVVPSSKTARTIASELRQPKQMAAPKTGKKLEIPEVDRAAFFKLDQARTILYSYLRPVIDLLEKHLALR